MRIAPDNLGHSPIVALSDDGRQVWKAKRLTAALAREIAMDEWLPPASVLGEDVDHLRAELAERLAAAKTAASNLDAIREKFAREDDAQIRVAADAIRAGTPAPDERTSPEDRLAAIREHSEAADAAELALLEAQDDALGYVLEHVSRWDSTRAELDRRAAEGMAEAERIMAEARALDQAGASLAMWLERNRDTAFSGLARGWSALRHAKRREHFEPASVTPTAEADSYTDGAEAWVNA